MKNITSTFLYIHTLLDCNSFCFLRKNLALLCALFVTPVVSATGLNNESASFSATGAWATAAINKWLRSPLRLTNCSRWKRENPTCCARHDLEYATGALHPPRRLHSSACDLLNIAHGNKREWTNSLPVQTARLFSYIHMRVYYTARTAVWLSAACSKFLAFA